MTEKKEKRKKTRRDSKKYPNLEKSYNLKSRQDYMDNVNYVNGVKNTKGETVIRAMLDSEKEYLDKFNAEYYGASFDKDDSNNLHKFKATPEELDVVRQNIRELKLKIKDGEKKGMNRIKLKALYKEVEETREHLLTLNPKLRCTDANNQRNICLLNIGKMTNDVKFISWDDLDQDTIGALDLELLYILNDIDRDKK